MKLDVEVDIPLSNRILKGMTKLDRDLAKSTHGKIDLATVSMLGFLGLAALQVRNRRILPPAWTLLTGAIGTLVKSAEAKEVVARQARASSRRGRVAARRRRRAVGA